jgi:hypothetical protein
MASEAAAEAIRYDELIWRPLVSGLLKTFENDGVEDRDSFFLESLERRTHQKDLSLDQAKWVLDIKFRRTIIARYKGILVGTLIKECFESCHLIIDDLLVEWIQKLHRARAETLRGGQVARLYRIWISLESEY